MKNTTGIPQLFLRLALGIGFIIPVMDRLGWLGEAGTAKVAWGDWQHFVTYTHSLMPYLNERLASVMAVLATMAEALFGVCLIAGYQTRFMALGCAALTFIFALCMMNTQGISAPFSYPVFVFTGAGLVLSGVTEFKWSLDYYLRKNRLPIT